ncbi:OLC1v1010857C1 [Oldenlandia corymbosa var. corymbosa]|uniref:OLC1v1010857C1 n=1 Tax=Oldenlandia corymbosa var. corymbosa TaxID=529605 RepID=A0AAV1DVI0_OLDCO|nr:OLC1v1010857C1 [Oldenlandia corymbosa var. corymbosa]
MDQRGQEKDVVLPSYSMAYINPTSYNNESASAPVASKLADRRLTNESRRSSPAIPSSGQTLDQNPPPPPPPQIHINNNNNDSNPDPDPAQELPNATVPRETTAQPQVVQPPAPAIRYRECQKNHAASMGGHVTDGCGEFMPGGEEGTPEAFKCAACDCHRNFHRKETDADTQPGTSSYHALNHGHHNNNSIFRGHAPTSSLITMTHHHQNHRQHKLSRGPPAPIMMTFGGNGGGGAAESSSEDLDVFQYSGGGGGQGMMMHPSSYSASKKRFRTKFTQQQKDRMNEFAEKLGWRIQKQDDREVQQFCNEVGVKRQVFKVWMHNNKQAMKKKST